MTCGGCLKSIATRNGGLYGLFGEPWLPARPVKPGSEGSLRAEAVRVRRSVSPRPCHVLTETFTHRGWTLESASARQ